MDNTQKSLFQYLININFNEIKDKSIAFATKPIHQLSKGDYLFYIMFRQEQDNPRNNCPKYWRRKLRSEWKKAIEYKHCLGHSITDYCSAESSSIRKKELDSQKYQLSNIYIRDKKTGRILTNQDNKPLSLFDITKKKDEKRLASLLNRIHALELFAESDSNVIKMYTITLLGEYHSNPKNGNNTFNGKNPNECKNLINKGFREARRRMYNKISNIEDRQINYFRIFEPHKDGTPHSHLLLVAPEYVHNLFVQEMNKTPSIGKLTESNRSIITFDKTKSKLSTYLFKYLTKNIYEEIELNSENSTKAKIDIWGNFWKIRQFDFGGSHTQGVTKYNLLRRLTNYTKDFFEFANSDKQITKAIYSDFINSYGEQVKRINGVEYNETKLEATSYELIDSRSLANGTSHE